MGAVHCAESVAYIYFRKGGQLLGKFGVVLLLLLMEAEVFKQQYLAILQRGGLLLRLFAYAVGGKIYVHIGQQLLKPLRHRRKGKLLLHFALGAAKMGAEYYPRALLKQIVYRGQAGGYALIIAHVSVCIQRNVVVHADKHALGAHVNVFYRLFHK